MAEPSEFRKQVDAAIAQRKADAAKLAPPSKQDVAAMQSLLTAKSPTGQSTGIAPSPKASITVAKGPSAGTGIAKSLGSATVAFPTPANQTGTPTATYPPMGASPVALPTMVKPSGATGLLPGQVSPTGEIVGGNGRDDFSLPSSSVSVPPMAPAPGAGKLANTLETSRPEKASKSKQERFAKSPSSLSRNLGAIGDLFSQISGSGVSSGNLSSMMGGQGRTRGLGLIGGSHSDLGGIEKLLGGTGGGSGSGGDQSELIDAVKDLTDAVKKLTEKMSGQDSESIGPPEYLAAHGGDGGAQNGNPPTANQQPAPNHQGLRSVVDGLVASLMGKR